MSISHAAARIYASALFDVAADAGTVEQVGEELHAVSDAIDGLDPQLRTFFVLPQLTRDDKWRVIRQAFEHQVGRTVLGLLHVLVDKRREALLGAIVDEFDGLLDERLGRVRAGVVTARPLDDELVAALRSALERQTQRQVVLDQRVDPNVIGGIRVSLGDLVVDGTLRRALADMRQALSTTLA